MLFYVRSSLFDSPAQTLVNTVNIVGVMGKGVALEFKKRFPEMFRAYKSLCNSGSLDIGKLHLWRSTNRYVLNFPTKTTWKKPSKIDYIEAGLSVFVDSYKEMGISSISFPPLGCGNGNLNWSDVRPVMERYLSNLEIPVYVHDRQVSAEFVPEHKLDGVHRMPVTFSDFLHDIRDRLREREGRFHTLKGQGSFSAFWQSDGGIMIERSGRNDAIKGEYIEWAWATLQNGILSADQFPGEEARKTKSYLFPILADLPYVQATEISKPGWSANTPGHGLFFRRDRRRENPVLAHADANVGDQACLSL